MQFKKVGTKDVDKLRGGEFVKLGFGISEFVKVEPWLDTHNVLIATVLDKTKKRVGIIYRRGDKMEVFEKV